MDVYVDIVVGSFYLMGSLASLFKPLWTLFPALLFLIASVAATAKELFLFFKKEKDRSFLVLAVGYICFIGGSIVLFSETEVRPAAGPFLAGSLLLFGIDRLKKKTIFHTLGILCFVVGSAIFFIPDFDAKLASGVLFTSGAAIFVFVAIYFENNFKPVVKIAIAGFILLVLGTELLFIFDFESLRDKNVSQEINYVAFAATFVSLSNNLPQLVHTYELNSVENFNTWSLLLWTVSASTWLTYGIILQSSALILNNSIGILSALFLLYYKLPIIKQWLS